MKTPSLVFILSGSMLVSSLKACAEPPIREASLGQAPAVDPKAQVEFSVPAGNPTPAPITGSSSSSAGELSIQPESSREGTLALCQEIDRLYARNKWGSKSPCSKIHWASMGLSVQKRPLLTYQKGDPLASKLNVLQCGIHGDELPSIAMCFRFIEELEKGLKPLPPHTRVVVQPLLNPDGMLDKKPQRANSRGIDINRNFPTQDWAANALASWKKKDHGDPRKFPGSAAGSEPETSAIVSFVNREKPQKIISIHTPLGFLDLDSKGGPDKERRAKYLAINMSKNSGNYTFRTFGFYPGSLGNFAGREKQIPVYTLELPEGGTAKPTIDRYWSKFRVALWRAIDFDLDTGQFVED